MKASIQERIPKLVAEVASGEQKRDHLINASDDFSGQVQAYYFSNARRFLSSMVGDLDMNGKQDLKELRLKKLLGV